MHKWGIIGIFGIWTRISCMLGLSRCWCTRAELDLLAIISSRVHLNMYGRIAQLVGAVQTIFIVTLTVV